MLSSRKQEQKQCRVPGIEWERCPCRALLCHSFPAWRPSQVSPLPEPANVFELYGGFMLWLNVQCLLGRRHRLILLWVLLQFTTYLFRVKKAYTNSLFPPPHLQSIFSGCGWKSQCPPKAGHRHLLWLVQPESLRSSQMRGWGSRSTATVSEGGLRSSGLRHQLRNKKVHVLFHEVTVL